MSCSATSKKRAFELDDPSLPSPSSPPRELRRSRRRMESTTLTTTSISSSSSSSSSVVPASSPLNNKQHQTEKEPETTEIKLPPLESVHLSQLIPNLDKNKAKMQDEAVLIVQSKIPLTYIFPCSENDISSKKTLNEQLKAAAITALTFKPPPSLSTSTSATSSNPTNPPSCACDVELPYLYIPPSFDIHPEQFSRGAPWIQRMIMLKDNLVIRQGLIAKKLKTSDGTLSLLLNGSYGSQFVAQHMNKVRSWCIEQHVFIFRKRFKEFADYFWNSFMEHKIKTQNESPLQNSVWSTTVFSDRLKAPQHQKIHHAFEQLYTEKQEKEKDQPLTRSNYIFLFAQCLDLSVEKATCWWTHHWMGSSYSMIHQHEIDFALLSFIELYDITRPGYQPIRKQTNQADILKKVERAKQHLKLKDSSVLVLSRALRFGKPLSIYISTKSWKNDPYEADPETETGSSSSSSSVSRHPLWRPMPSQTSSSQSCSPPLIRVDAPFEAENKEFISAVLWSDHVSKYACTTLAALYALGKEKESKYNYFATSSSSIGSQSSRKERERQEPETLEHEEKENTQQTSSSENIKQNVHTNTTTTTCGGLKVDLDGDLQMFI